MGEVAQQELWAPPEPLPPMLKQWRVHIAGRDYSGTVLWTLWGSFPTEAEAKRVGRAQSFTAFKIEYVEFPE